LQKGLKRIDPARTDTDTTASIAVIIDSLGIQAAVLHVVPYFVLSAMSNGCLQMAALVITQIAPLAPAILQRFAAHYGESAAMTAAKPKRTLIVAASPGKDQPVSKHLTGQVFDAARNRDRIANSHDARSPETGVVVRAGRTLVTFALPAFLLLYRDVEE